MTAKYLILLIFIPYICCSVKYLTHLEKGLVLEPIRSLITSEGSVSIPISLSFPLEIEIHHNLSCIEPTKDIVRTGIKYVMNHIKYTVPSVMSNLKTGIKDKRRRRKRFVSSILGGTALGLGLWNKYKISDLQDQIDIIENNIEILQDNMKKIQSSESRAYDQLEKFHHFVSESFNSLKQEISRLECNAIRFMFSAMNWELWMTTVVQDFKDAANNLLIGQTTTSLIPQAQITSLRKISSEVDDLISLLGIGAFYEITSVHPVLIDPDKMQIIAILIIPIIERMIPNSAYTVYTVPWIQNSTSCVMKFPSIVATSDSSSIVWVPDMSSCHSTKIHTICPFDMIERTQDPCLTDLIFYNKSDKCDIFLKQGPLKPEIRVLDSGILLGAYQDQEVSCSPTMSNLPPISFPKTSKKPELIISDQCKMLHINARSLFVPRNIPDVIKINLSISNLESTIDLSSHLLLEDTWTPLKDLPKLDQIHSTRKNHTLLWILVGFCILVIIIISVLLWIHRSKTQKYFKIIKGSTIWTGLSKLPNTTEEGKRKSKNNNPINDNSEQVELFSIH